MQIKLMAVVGSWNQLPDRFQTLSDHHLVVCHIRFPSSLDKEAKLKRARKAAKKIWSKVSPFGMMVTVWTGSEEENAYVGIKSNRKEEVVPKDS